MHTGPYAEKPTDQGLNFSACDTTESALMHRIKHQDVQALGELYDRHSAVLYSLATRILADHEKAKEVLQKVFSRIWLEAGSFDHSVCQLFAWLVTLTREEAFQCLRLRMPARLIFISNNRNFDLTNIRPGNLESILGVLTAEECQVIELAYFNGLSCDEISKQLGKPVEIIKARIFQGMSRLLDACEGNTRLKYNRQYWER